MLIGGLCFVVPALLTCIYIHKSFIIRSTFYDAVCTWLQANIYHLRRPCTLTRICVTIFNEGIKFHLSSVLNASRIPVNGHLGLRRLIIQLMKAYCRAKWAIHSFTEYMCIRPACIDTDSNRKVGFIFRKNTR